MRAPLAIGLMAAALTACGQAQPLTVPYQMPQRPIVRSQSDAGVQQAMQLGMRVKFDTTDKNKDGVLSKDEYASWDPKMVAVIDTNHDSKLSLPEFMAAIKLAEPTIVGAFRSDEKARFETFDVNHDGVMSQGEFLEERTVNLPKPVFPEFLQIQVAFFNLSDVNRDRRLDFSEYEDFKAWYLTSLSQVPSPATSSVPSPAATQPSTSGRLR